MAEIVLRSLQIDDAETFALHANNIAIANNMTNQFPFPYTKEHALEFIRRINSLKPAQVFAIDFEGEAIGAIGLHPQNDIFLKNAELGYWLAEKFWGRGFVSVAINKIVEYGFGNFEIDRIFARPFGSNRSSQRVLEKTGFVLEARLEKIIYKNNRYEDELIYAIRKR
ncbi:MAG TPA: GNAT family N-acetyltransferase [Bacteroidia bacterium]|jgi:ribosomal-protein-alanine N-acetyltransferase|nr:GNAT family N-acetyltransferase [Bacteroidia bacterium]HMU19444.1 GNAT family N-acetyltransferase [Bacteroidia bacterium]